MMPREASFSARGGRILEHSAWHRTAHAKSGYKLWPVLALQCRIVPCHRRFLKVCRHRSPVVMISPNFTHGLSVHGVLVPSTYTGLNSRFPLLMEHRQYLDVYRPSSCRKKDFCKCCRLVSV